LAIGTSLVVGYDTCTKIDTCNGVHIVGAVCAVYPVYQCQYIGKTMTDKPNIQQQPLPQQFSFKQINKFVRKLNVKNNDVILVRQGSMLAREDVIHQIIKVLENIGTKNVAVMVVDDFSNIDKADEAEMAKAGWYRLPAIKNILHRGGKDV
jgi:hypothetical protein